MGAFDRREKIASRLSGARPAHLPPLKVCIEVNVSGEASKSGVAPEAVLALANRVVALPRLELRGLMPFPSPRRTRCCNGSVFAFCAS